MQLQIIILFLFLIARIEFTEQMPLANVVNGVMTTVTVNGGMSPIQKPNFLSNLLPNEMMSPWSPNYYGVEEGQDGLTIANNGVGEYTEEELCGAALLAQKGVPISVSLNEFKQKREEEKEKSEKADISVKTEKKRKVKKQKINYNLESYAKFPKAKEYEAMVNEAKAKIRLEERTFNKFTKSIERALKKRKLMSIRMIGIGSMRFHMDHYSYTRYAEFHKKTQMGREETAKTSQNRAVYQNALALLVAEHFNENQQQQNEGKEKSLKIKMTSEDLYLGEKSENKYLRKQGIVPMRAIEDEEGMAENLGIVPNELRMMIPRADDEATLVLMFSGTTQMTFNILSAYEPIIGRLILLESGLQYPYPAGSFQEKATKYTKEKFGGNSESFPNTELGKKFFDGAGTVLRWL